MLQAYVSSVFRCFIIMFASVSSECCIRMTMVWFRVGAPRISGPAGLGLIFRPRFSGSDTRNLSGSVLGFSFHPWIPDGCLCKLLNLF
jgi:hypothetical protein